MAVVVSQATEYGAVVSSAPISTPSSLNCTPATATLSEAVAPTLIVRATVEPALGELMATEGAALSTVTVMGPDVLWFPAVSRATAVKT